MVVNNKYPKKVELLRYKYDNRKSIPQQTIVALLRSMSYNVIPISNMMLYC